MRRLLVLIWILLLLTASGALAYELTAEDEGYLLMAETETRALLLNQENMNARLIDLTTGGRWDTMVMDAKKGNKTIKNTQKSALTVTYIVNAQNATVNVADSYSQSISTGTFDVASVENGFEVHYTISNDTLIIDDLPKAIPVSKYNVLLEKGGWSDKEKKVFTDNYRAIKYSGMSEELMIRVKDDSLSILQIKQLHGLIFSAGLYTEEDLEADNALVAYERVYLPEHKITLRYQLDGDDLVVTLPAGDIVSTEDNEITQISLMPYFLSADDTCEGYMLVPDGSGALIHLNNQKLAATSYTTKVYGQDALINASTYVTPRRNTTLPVFGIKRNDSAVLAIIEKGAEIAILNADISERVDEYNRIGVTFALREIENVSLVGNDSITSPRYASDVYQGDIIMRYKLLPTEQSDYLGMAKAYRQYLIAQGLLSPVERAQDSPFYLELIGAVQKDKFFLGIPYTSSVQATTLSQARVVYQAVRDEQVKNIKLIYSGLFYGGVKHAALTRPTLDGGMGSMDELKKLQEMLASNGDQLYPGVYFGRVFSQRDFSRVNQAARRHDGEPARVSVFSTPIMKLRHTKQDGYYVSPLCLEDYTNRAMNSLRVYPFDGLNLFDLGNTLIPDYKRGHNMSRIHATEIYRQALGKLASSYPLILDDPMLYALPYASAATNLPFGDNGFSVVDAAIPFVQYTLAGCMDLSGESWNLHNYNGLEPFLLWSLESLQSPRFTLTYAQPTIFQNTEDMDYLSYFTTYYGDWAKTCGEMYSAFNDFYALVRDSDVISHEIVDENVRVVRYDNGVTLMLNYGQTDALYAGITLPAQGYIIHEEVLP